MPYKGIILLIVIWAVICIIVAWFAKDMSFNHEDDFDEYEEDWYNNEDDKEE